MIGKEFVFVDVSNLWIEGQRKSAVKTGLARNIWEAQVRHVLDFTWRIDVRGLHEVLVDWSDSRVALATLVGSSTENGMTWWEAARRAGFEIMARPRKSGSGEKGVDVALSGAVLKAAYGRMRPRVDSLTLVAGDADFVPLVADVRSLGLRVRVAFWQHASADMKDAADEFVELDHFFSHLTYRGGRLAA
ncbi:MAG: NYN domain-containing protein [Thermoanaerobaculia bacterium]|jgi:uncharacterized LabA/DUF88 family protein|nr:NYN domain-containing protein [Thermoanaerobaculia bacterium]